MEKFEGPFTLEHLDKVASIFGLEEADCFEEIRIYDGRLVIVTLEAQTYTGETPEGHKSGVVQQAQRVTRTYYLPGHREKPGVDFEEETTFIVLEGKALTQNREVLRNRDGCQGALSPDHCPDCDTEHSKQNPLVPVGISLSRIRNTKDERLLEPDDQRLESE